MQRSCYKIVRFTVQDTSIIWNIINSRVKILNLVFFYLLNIQKFRCFQINDQIRALKTRSRTKAVTVVKRIYENINPLFIETISKVSPLNGKFSPKSKPQNK